MANFFGISDSLPHMVPNRKQNHIYHPKQTLHNTSSHTTSILFIPLLLKTLTPLILSFFVFSFLFLHHSWLHFSHLMTLSSQFLSHGADKNYIFLLCNGLLVLVAKYSYWTLKTHSVPFSSSEPITSHYLDPSTDLSTQFGSHISLWENDSPQDQTEPPLHLEKDSVSVREKKEEEYKVGIEEPEKEVYMEEEDEEGENGKMSTEELNRKIEDFIRKRKEELRIEALQQQQLILVYD